MKTSFRFNTFAVLCVLKTQIDHLSFCFADKYDTHMSINESAVPRVRSMLDLLDEYKLNHGWDTLRNESPDLLCRRKFMRFGWFNCALVGNCMGAVLTNLITSVIFNRTFLVVDPDCYGAMVPREWVPKINNLREIMAAANCPVNFNDAPQIDFQKIPDSNLVLINEPDLFNKAFDMIHPLRMDVPMTAEQRKRAEILFSHPIDDVARFESYGLAFINAIEFTNKTKSLVNPILRDTILFREENELPHRIHQLRNHPQEDSESHLHAIAHHRKKTRKAVIVGIHLRHYDGDSHEKPEIDANFDKTAVLALDEIHAKIYQRGDYTTAGYLNSAAETLDCLVLISSDRPHSIRAITRHAEKLHCEARILPKNMSAEPAYRHTDPVYTETGKERFSI